MKQSIFFIFLLSFVGLCLSHILKLNECNNFDANFSKIKYHHRLIGEILAFVGEISLRKCLTKCMYHPVCLTLNYRRENSTCELLGVAGQLYDPFKISSFVAAEGWHHFETDYGIKKLGRWCSINNPCQHNERCEDICGGTHRCVAVESTLRNVIAQYSESTVYNGRDASKAFDGDESTITHTIHDKAVAHWIKATFGKRVFITSVEVVSRLEFIDGVYSSRNDNTDLKTILREGDQTVEKVFGNTGVLYDRVVLQCNRLADELLAYQSQQVADQTGGILNIGEIWIYGGIVY